MSLCIRDRNANGTNVGNIVGQRLRVAPRGSAEGQRRATRSQLTMFQTTSLPLSVPPISRPACSV